jgi:prevent-host-death family protein
MVDITKDVQSVTAFRRNTGGFLKRLKKTKRPIILTVKGKAEAVVQDAASYQRLLDIAALGDAREGIRQARGQSRLGLGQDLEEFLADFEAEHGV